MRRQKRESRTSEGIDRSSPPEVPEAERPREVTERGLSPAELTLTQLYFLIVVVVEPLPVVVSEQTLTVFMPLSASSRVL